MTRRRKEDSEDEAPEAVTLASSKDAALGQLKAEMTATAQQAREVRERRRKIDERNKTQAAERKRKVVEALEQLRKGMAGDGEEDARKRIPIAAPKHLLPSLDASSEREERMIKVLKDKHVMLLRESPVGSKKDRQIVKTLGKTKEDLLLRYSKAARAPPTLSRAKHRLGKPAASFVLKNRTARQILAHKLQKPPKKARKNSREYNNQESDILSAK